MSRLPKAMAVILTEAAELAGSDPEALQAVGLAWVNQPVRADALQELNRCLPRDAEGVLDIHKIKPIDKALRAYAWRIAGLAATGMVKTGLGLALQAACWDALYGDLLAPHVRAEIRRPWAARKLLAA